MMEPLQPHQKSWAVAITARATYLKPWYEGFAAALPDSWHALLINPADDSPPEHPLELTTPRHSKLSIEEITARVLRSEQSGKSVRNFGKQSTWMPSRRLGGVMDAWRCGGLIAHEFSPFTLAAILHAKRRRLPVVSFGDVGRANANHFPLKTRLWHGLWSWAVDGRMAGCPAARVLVGGRRVPVVESYHAVDSDVFRPLPKLAATREVAFVYSGQLILRKGLDLWFEAAGRLVRRTQVPFRLRVLGGGDEAWARQSAEQAGVAERVDWCGFLRGEEMKQALGSADVFVLPSRFDSYAAVVHEAACLGLPLLVSRHAGAAEAIVEDGVNGWQIDPDDSADFSLRMEALLDAQTRSRMSVAARAAGERLCARRRGAAVWEWITREFPI